VDVNGHYTMQTLRAVQMFQQHFFAGSRRNHLDEKGPEEGQPGHG
jgi:hypothetical protein